MKKSNTDQAALLLEIQKLKQEKKLLNEAFEILTSESKTKEDSLKRRNDILLKLTDFYSELAFLPYTEIYPCIVAKIKELFGVKGAWVTSYDEESSELVVEFSSLSLEENARFYKLIGRNVLKLRTYVNQENYSKIMDEVFGIVYSVHDLTFGAIPDAIGKII